MGDPWGRWAKRIAVNIKRRRLQLSLTQEEAAHHIGLATRHYQKLEAGEVNITLRTIIRVAQALKMEPAALFRA